MLLLDRRTFDPSRRRHRHGRAVSLATTFCKHNPMLYDMARRANECVVLNATDSNRVVGGGATGGSAGPTAALHGTCAHPQSRIQCYLLRCIFRLVARTGPTVHRGGYLLIEVKRTEMLR